MSTFAKVVQFLAQDAGLKLTVETAQEFLADPEAALYLLPVRDSWGVVQQFPVHAQFSRQLMAADVIHFQQGKWIPRLVILDVFRRLVVENAGDLDIRQSAYVIGRGECARVAAGFAAQNGYRNIFIVDEMVGSNRENIQHLSRLFLGVRFSELLNSQLVLNAEPGSLIINADDLIDQKLLLQDISYFNFMTLNGFVLDAEVGTSENLLYYEAKKANLKASSGYEMLYWYMCELTHLLDISWTLSKEEGVEKIKTFIQSS